MPRCKSTNFFSVTETFFKKNADNAPLAMASTQKAKKQTSGIISLEAKHNTNMKTIEKLMITLPQLSDRSCLDLSSTVLRQYV